MFFPMLFGGRLCSFSDSLAVSGNGVFTFDYAYPYLYVTDEGASGNSILKIYDVTGTPTLLSTTSLPNASGAREPLIVGDLLYVPYRTSRHLAIWNVADRTAPVLSGSVSLPNSSPGGPFAVAVIGSVACVAYAGSFTMATTAEKVDVSNPASPSVIANWGPSPPTISTATDVISAGGNFVITGTFTGGSSVPYLAVVDPTTFATEDWLSFSVSGAVGGKLASDGSYAYSYAGNTTHLFTFDISNPLVISQAHDLNLSGTTGAGAQPSPLCLVDDTDRLYLGRYNGSGLLIAILNISTRSTPSLAGTISTNSETVTDLAVIDGCAGFAWGQGTGATIHLLETAPTS